MSVAINTERKGIEISWDPSGGVTDPPDVPPDFPGWETPHPEHPIAGEHPDHDLPGDLPPDQPVDPGEPPSGEVPGYNPPIGLPEPPHYPYPVSAETHVRIFGQGQAGDWHNSPVVPNDGLASLSYPKGFEGSSYIEVRKLDGSLVDAGVITVA